MNTLVEDKARALLTAGAVTVTGVDQFGVTAVVQGYTSSYRVAWSVRSGWTCTCPDLKRRCAHMRAVRRVTDVTDQGRE